MHTVLVFDADNRLSISVGVVACVVLFQCADSYLREHEST